MYIPRDQFRDVFSYSPFLDIGFHKGVFPIFQLYHGENKTVVDYHYFCRFELEDMSIYEILSAVDLTQFVHDEIRFGMHRGSNFKFPEYL
jgi:hypothetical protein